jgi:hypothetical protein
MVVTYENAILDDAIILLLRHAWGRIDIIDVCEQQPPSCCVDGLGLDIMSFVRYLPMPLLAVGYHVTLFGLSRSISILVRLGIGIGVPVLGVCLATSHLFLIDYSEPLCKNTQCMSTYTLNILACISLAFDRICNCPGSSPSICFTHGSAIRQTQSS